MGLNVTGAHKRMTLRVLRWRAIAASAFRTEARLPFVGYTIRLGMLTGTTQAKFDRAYRQHRKRCLQPGWRQRLPVGVPDGTVRLGLQCYRVTGSTVLTGHTSAKPVLTQMCPEYSPSISRCERRGIQSMRGRLPAVATVLSVCGIASTGDI